MKYWKTLLVLSTIMLIASCDKNNSNSKVPNWEFNLNINGVEHHWKAKLERDYTFTTFPNIGARASVYTGVWSVYLLGNSTTDIEYISGEPLNLYLSFDENTKEILQIQDMATSLILYSNQISNQNIYLNVTDFGSKTIINSVDDYSFGDPIKITISNASFVDPIFGNNYTISGTIKAIY